MAKNAEHVLSVAADKASESMHAQAREADLSGWNGQTLENMKQSTNVIDVQQLCEVELQVRHTIRIIQQCEHMQVAANDTTDQDNLGMHNRGETNPATTTLQQLPAYPHIAGYMGSRAIFNIGNNTPNQTN